ncbi:MAG TPA: carboxypeptidase-like regulatory domain-containing protein [Candidatus Kapabacteria bacterium]
MNAFRINSFFSRLPFLLIISSIAILIGCGDDSPTSTNSTPVVTTGTITGHLTRKEDDRPIQGATIKLIPSGKTSQTLSDGSFSFSKVNPATYTLDVDWGNRGNGSLSGIKVTAGKNTDVPVEFSTPVGDWSLTVILNGSPVNYQLTYFDDLTYEVRGRIYQTGTWKIRDEGITMEADKGNDRWLGLYDPFLMTGTISTVGYTGTWTAIR